MELVRVRIESSAWGPDEPAALAELDSWSPQGEVHGGASGFGVPAQAYVALEERPHEFELEAMIQFLRAAPPELATEVARLLGSGLSFALLPQDVAARVPHLTAAVGAAARHDHALQRLDRTLQTQARLQRLQPVVNDARALLAMANLVGGGIGGLFYASRSSQSRELSPEPYTAVLAGSIVMLIIGSCTILRCMCRGKESFGVVPEPFVGGSVVRIPAAARRMAEEWQALVILNLTVSGGDARAAISAQRQAAAGPEWTVQLEPLTAGPDAAPNPATQLDHDLAARWKGLLIDEIGSRGFRERLTKALADWCCDTIGHHSMSQAIRNAHVNAAGLRVIDTMDQAEGPVSDEAAQAMLRLRTSVTGGALHHYLSQARAPRMDLVE
jgi:hypothetical protein